MSLRPEISRSILAKSIYCLLDPIPFGCFSAALIFDVIYYRTSVMLWDKGAAWLIVFGLLFAVVPRLINLIHVWVTSKRIATRADRMDFWLNLIAILLAIDNSFVHSRDAYAVVPTGLWLSAITVLLLAIGNIAVTVERAMHRGNVNE